MSKTKTPVSSIIYTALLVASVSLIGWAVAPGDTNNDTINMLTQAKTGMFQDWLSPFVAGIWFLLGGQPSWVLSLTLFVTLGGIAFFAYKIFKAGWFPPLNSMCPRNPDLLHTTGAWRFGLRL